MLQVQWSQGHHRGRVRAPGWLTWGTPGGTSSLPAVWDRVFQHEKWQVLQYQHPSSTARLSAHYRSHQMTFKAKGFFSGLWIRRISNMYLQNLPLLDTYYWINTLPWLPVLYRLLFSLKSPHLTFCWSNLSIVSSFKTLGSPLSPGQPGPKVHTELSTQEWSSCSHPFNQTIHSKKFKHVLSTTWHHIPKGAPPGTVLFGYIHLATYQRA